MPPVPKDSRLPVKLLIGSNTAWIREDLGPLDELIADLRQHGQLLPIVTTSRYQVIDGARRIMAADQLGWTDIRAIATDDFHTVEKLFVEALRLDDAGRSHRRPMSYVDIMDLIPLLRELYQPISRAQATASRKKGKARTNYHRAGPLQAFADMLGMKLGHLEQLSRSSAILNKARLARNPEALARVREAIRRTEEAGQIYALDISMRTAFLEPLPPRKADAAIAKAQRGALDRAITAMTGTVMALPKPEELEIEIHSKEDMLRWDKEITRLIQQMHRLRKAMRDATNQEETSNEQS